MILIKVKLLKRLNMMKWLKTWLNAIQTISIQNNDYNTKIGET